MVRVDDGVHFVREVCWREGGEESAEVPEVLVTESLGEVVVVAILDEPGLDTAAGLRVERGREPLPVGDGDDFVREAVEDEDRAADVLDPVNVREDVEAPQEPVVRQQAHAAQKR